ncbi:PIN domain-containing protein [Candidatus Poribacteria bacterium]|nr:PIN domain-containing protein [Candidatus Poribacteria bacterium]
MPAVRRDFSSSLEDFIYWDASFAIAAVIDTELYYSECSAFARRLRVESIISSSSDFTHNELAFYILKSAYVTEARIRGIRWTHLQRQRPGIVTATMPVVLARKAELESMTLHLPVTETVKDRAFELMLRYALFPTNAYHVAVALEHGVNAFATLDEDLLRMNGIFVYTCLPLP